MRLIIFLGTIYGSHCTISANFYLYLQYFQQKVFSFSKINESQTDYKAGFGKRVLRFPDSTFLFLVGPEYYLRNP